MTPDEFHKAMAQERKLAADNERYWAKRDYRCAAYVVIGLVLCVGWFMIQIAQGVGP